MIQLFGGMKYVMLVSVSPWLPVLLITEEGESFICCHPSSGTTRFFSRKVTQMWYPVSGYPGGKQQAGSCRAASLYEPKHALPWLSEAGGPRWGPRVRSLQRHCIPRRRGDTWHRPPLTPSLSSLEWGRTALVAAPEALRAVILPGCKTRPWSRSEITSISTVGGQVTMKKD